MTLLCRKVFKFQRCSETDTVCVLLTQGETHSSGVQPSFATKNADGLPEIVSTKTSLRRRKSAFTMSQLPRLLFKAPCAACPSTTNGPPLRRRDPRARSAPPARSSRCPPPRARINTSRNRSRSTAVSADHSRLRASKTGSYMCTRTTRAGSLYVIMTQVFEVTGQRTVTRASTIETFYGHAG